MKYKRKQKPLNICLSAEDKQMIKNISSVTGVPASILIKMILNSFFNKYKDGYFSYCNKDEKSEERNKETLTICLDNKILNIINEINKVERLTVSSLIREILKDFLSECQKNNRIILSFDLSDNF